MRRHATPFTSDAKKKEEEGSQAKEDAMRTMLSALIAVAIVAVAAVPASAGPDAKQLFEKLDREKY
jgi:hypothetical protein